MSDEQAIADAEHDREHGHLDPIAVEQAEAAQDRYERALWSND